jgi:hypothetical protein
MNNQAAIPFPLSNFHHIFAPSPLVCCTAPAPSAATAVAGVGTPPCISFDPGMSWYPPVSASLPVLPPCYFAMRAAALATLDCAGTCNTRQHVIRAGEGGGRFFWRQAQRQQQCDWQQRQQQRAATAGGGSSSGLCRRERQRQQQQWQWAAASEIRERQQQFAAYRHALLSGNMKCAQTAASPGHSGQGAQAATAPLAVRRCYPEAAALLLQPGSALGCTAGLCWLRGAGT